MAASDPAQSGRGRAWLPRLIANPGFQRWAARLPIARRLARRDGEEIFHIIQGFVASQVLSALVETGLLHRLMEGAQPARALAAGAGIAEDRMATLLQAGAALGFVRRRRDGRFAIARKGAALLGVPGLEDMIRHHRGFYADMADPVALLRGEVETEMARFWPYVFGQSGTIPDVVSRRYSDLMARSQDLVAQDTLRMVGMGDIGHLMDVGGGTGAFLGHVLDRYPRMRATLFDLPGVMPAARAGLERAGLADRIALCPGSFRDEPLPRGADAVSLVRVLYDHDDETVAALLARVHEALPPGGRLIVSEPMSGGDRPDKITDVYFAFYTLAMGTGRTRSAARIAEMCRAAGFDDIAIPRAPRRFVTSVVVAKRAV